MKYLLCPKCGKPRWTRSDRNFSGGISVSIDPCKSCRPAEPKHQPRIVRIHKIAKPVVEKKPQKKRGGKKGGDDEGTD